MMKLKKTALTMLAIGTVAMLFTACGSPKKGETRCGREYENQHLETGRHADCRI